jgi:hypothetical protein
MCAATYVLIWNKNNEDSTNIYLDFFPVGESRSFDPASSFKIWI